jgi:hypothetical protein
MPLGARFGGVAERFKAPVLKTGVRESVPWVRIPPPLPFIWQTKIKASFGALFCAIYPLCAIVPFTPRKSLPAKQVSMF